MSEMRYRIATKTSHTQFTLVAKNLLNPIQSPGKIVNS